MASPDDLLEIARREAMQAQQQHQEAEALQREGDEQSTRQAENLEGASAILYMRSQRAKKIARDTKNKLEQIDKKLSESQTTLKKLEDDKKSLQAAHNYKTPDSLLGEGVRADAAAAQEEHQAAELSSHTDDPYKVSQAENLAAKALTGRQLAEQARADAEDLRQKLNDIDKDISSISTEIQSLEQEKESLIRDMPRI